jgi:hypothetical protein
MRYSRAILLAAASLLLPGCIARTMVGVVTAPVRVAGKAVDLATTSQSESDEKRGRALRQREEQLGRLDRSYQRHAQQCADGSASACERADAERAELDRTAPTAPNGAD